MKILKKLVSHPRVVVFLVLATLSLLLNAITGIAPPQDGGEIP